ncbi:LacI family DNA-binding transcriptional regulator [bacterium]|nr:LacI family DNA-binding transcriptional regulator [bacterium]
MKSKTTIKDIAAKLDINTSTVSRALNDFPNLKDETKRKVLKAAKKMNYCPSHIAQGLSGKSTKVFALITPTLDPHVLPVIRGVTDACRKMRYALMLFPNDYWSDEIVAFTDIKGKWLVDGMLIYNVVYHKKISKEVTGLKNEEIPFVYINKFLNSGIVNTVSVDNFKSVYKVINHLYQLGHKKIGIINGNLASNDGRERFDAFKKSLKNLKLEYNEQYVGNGKFSETTAYNEMKKILSAGTNPTAVFCSSDLMAIGAMRAIREKGLRVPDDIAIAGFDDIALSERAEPPLTTLRVPLEDVGAKAVELLVDVIKNPRQAVKEFGLEAELITRKSSGKKR